MNNDPLSPLPTSASRQTPSKPLNCYGHTFAGLFDPRAIHFEEVTDQNAQEQLLRDILKSHYDEVTDDTLQAGDIVVRTGHCGFATGTGDKISQFGYSEDILPTANAEQGLVEKKRASGLNSQEDEELKKLTTALANWLNDHDLQENEVSFQKLKENLKVKYKVYRLKHCHSSILKPRPQHTGGGHCR